MLSVIFTFTLGGLAPAGPVPLSGEDLFIRTDDPQGHRPCQYSEEWEQLDPNDPSSPFAVEPGGYLWIAIENSDDPDKQKHIHLKLKISPTGKAKHLAKNGTAEFVGFHDDGTQKKGKGVVRCSEPWIYIDAWYTPQPDWEYIRLKNTHNLTIGITILKSRGCTICNNLYCEPSGEGEELWSLNIESSAIGIEGHTVNDPRFTKIDLYPEHSQVDALTAPAFFADPASGFWSGEMSYVDPDGEPRPQGGVRWSTEGPGLSAQENFALSLPLIGRADTLYSMYAWDDEGGEHQRFLLNLGGFPWYENFRHYIPLNGMHGQLDWQAWDEDPTFDACVSDLHAYNDTNSLEICADADMVNTFSDADAGKWAFTAWQYIPGDFQSGGPDPTFDGTYFLLLNTYEPGVAPEASDYSVSYCFDSNDGTLRVYDGSGGTTSVPYVTDQWVPIQCVIDLDNDWVQTYYNGESVCEYSWTGGVYGGGGGALSIACVDLWANGSTSVYYDEFALEQLDTPSECPADVNGDDVVDVLDLLAVIAAWGGPGPAEDVNGDGLVDVLDLLAVIAAWGPC